MPRKTTPVRWELVTRPTHVAELHRRSFTTFDVARMAFRYCITQDPCSASIYSYDKDGKTLARVYHFEGPT